MNTENNWTPVPKSAVRFVLKCKFCGAERLSGTDDDNWHCLVDNQAMEVISVEVDKEEM
jgi:hypothetical protein